jgi:hypothetical protein
MMMLLIQGILIPSHNVPEPPRYPSNVSSDEMPLSCRTPPCGGTWILRTTNARSIRSPEDGPIKIWQCSKGGHLCASNNEHLNGEEDSGNWIYRHSFFTWDGIDHWSRVMEFNL